MNTRIFFRFVQGLIILAPFALGAWLVWQEFVPSGVFVVEKIMGKPSPFLDDLLPGSRASLPHKDAQGDMVQSLTGDPVYLFVHPHRSFETITAEIWFKNTSIPLIEFGGLVSADNEAFNLHPLQNLLLDQFSWTRIQEGDRLLLQRDSTYSSLEDFFASPPAVEQVATYHDDWSVPYQPTFYIPSSIIKTTALSFRGHHTIKTYVKEETLSFSFTYMDMNREEGDDPVQILVFNEKDQAVAEARMVDDGVIEATALPSVLQTIIISVSDLPEGVYQIELNVGRDIFFRSITTSQQKWAFVRSLFVADEVGYRDVPLGAQLVTNAKQFSFQTRHAEGVQDVQIGEQTVSVTTPFETVAQKITQPGLAILSIPLGDIEIQSDGMIATSANTFFQPDPIPLTAQTDLVSLGVDYILATYVPPRQEGNWWVAEVNFNASILTQEQDAWKFVFSLPGILEQEGSVDVGKIRMTWTRDPLTWVSFWQFFQSYVFP